MNRAFFILAMALCLHVLADTITFVDDMEMTGPGIRVLRETDTQVEVQLQDYGSMMILKSRIKNIAIDYEARKKALVENKTDSGLDYFELGQLCEYYMMTAEAVDAYTTALDKAGLPADALLAMAQFFEKLELWPQARLAYEKYLRINKNDEAVKAKLAGLPEADAIALAPDKVEEAPPVAKEEPAEEAQPEVVDDADVVEELPVDQPEEQPGPEVALAKEGLEASATWRVETWGNPGTVEVVSQEENGAGNRVLTATYAGKDKDKTAVGALFRDPLDLSDHKELVFDLYNDSDQVLRVAFAVFTGRMEYIESTQITVPAKSWRRDITFDLDANDYKTQATNWLHKAAFSDRTAIRQLCFLLYSGAAQGGVQLDNILFKTAEELEQAK